MMNKLVIFDLDGVLIDSRELHYKALNDALRNLSEDYIITREEHLSIYDGLSTTKKLEMLSLNKGLDPKYYDSIWKDKQQATFELMGMFDIDYELVSMFRFLHRQGIRIAVASNSIRETVKLALLSIGVMRYVDYYVSNEDVKRSKPYPEMYWQCMTALNALPKDTVIFEDSHIGREGALNSGAHLIPIKDSYDMKEEKVREAVELLNGVKKKKISWRDNKMNVLIPMAGAGSRFAQAGYTFPKPLIEVHNKPMIQVVTDNLNV
jgi:beta-phosphoglucomutase-like phosphatase (HAD superfamily)